MFSGKDLPAVGVSIGIERVFAILEADTRQRAADLQARVRENETQVLVVSIGKGLQKQRMELASKLWAAGIAAEFGYKPAPNLKDQLHYADDTGVPFVVLFGNDELEKACACRVDVAWARVAVRMRACVGRM